MRRINANRIKNIVSELCISANTVLRKDIEKALRSGLKKETKKLAKSILKILLDNARIAKCEQLAICQDTGIVIVHIQLGQAVRIIGGDLEKAVNEGVKEGYKRGCFRKSIISDPVLRGNAKHTPAIIYIDIVKGDKIKITVSPKGFGSENKSKIKMLNPTDGVREIKNLVLDAVKVAGPDACPPFILGIGIGGSFEKAAILAKKALLEPIDRKNAKPHLKKLEDEVLRAINRLNIGPMGLGGKTTCLGVNIMDAPTHIAGLPVAVNVGCHATRSKTIII